MSRAVGLLLPLLGLAILLLVLGPGIGSHSAREPTPAPVDLTTAPTLEPRPGDRFVDVTEQAGLTFVHTLVDGEMSNVVENLGSGAAFLDFDGDGRLDIYFLQSGWLPGVVAGDEPERLPVNRLYRNLGEGRFEEVTKAGGADDPGFSLGVAAADYDGDGRTDLYVCNAGSNRLYRNRGDGTFEDRTREAGVEVPLLSAGATFFDYDGDSDLDLYVTNYLEFDPDYPYHYNPDAFPPPLAYEPQPDVLFRNLGDGTFEDVSEAAGILAETGRGMSVLAADFDEDGLTDLFVANDGTANFLWQNNGDGTFSENAILCGVAFGENGEATGAMTADLGDYDQDGRLDLFVTDTAFSSLYACTSPGFYVDEVISSQLALLTGQYVSWGGGFLDFDGDSRLDVFVVNGDLHHVVGWEDLLLRNEGDGIYSDAAAAAVYFQQKLMGRGGAVADFDNDGDPDILVTNLMDRPVLLRNDSPADVGRLCLSLSGRAGNRDAYGSRVVVHLPDRELHAEVRCPTSYLCSGDSRLLFGIGAETRVDRIEIRWPDGSRQVLHDVETGGQIDVAWGSS